MATLHLARCPRCGNSGAKIVLRRGKYYGHCSACLYSGPEKPTKADAIEAWNAEATHIQGETK